eukprot:scaffold81012_cov53-Phaeocystis_antarctica.AAC.3
MMGIMGMIPMGTMRPSHNNRPAREIDRQILGPTSAAAGGAFALARLTAQVGGAIAAHIEQPSERTIARSAGKKWNAATRSFV